MIWKMKPGETGLVIAAHGSHLNPDSATPAFRHGDDIRQLGRFAEVRESFWKEEPSFRETLRTVESESVVIVPLFMSGGYFVDRIIPREFRLREGFELDVDKRVVLSDPVGTHERMRDVILHRAASVTGDADVGPGYGLAIVGHGTERHEESARSTRAHVDRIARLNRFEEVRALFMDEPPYVENLRDHFDVRDVVVVPLFVADGYHTQEDIPADLGLTDGPARSYPTPGEVEEHRLWYTGAVGTDSRMVDVILERAAEAGVNLADANQTTPETNW